MDYGSIERVVRIGSLKFPIIASTIIKISRTIEKYAEYISEIFLLEIPSKVLTYLARQLLLILFEDTAVIYSIDRRRVLEVILSI